jgi:hypothetical protein
VSWLITNSRVVSAALIVAVIYAALMLIMDCLSRDLAGSQFGFQFAPVRRHT